MSFRNDTNCSRINKCVTFKGFLRHHCKLAHTGQDANPGEGGGGGGVLFMAYSATVKCMVFKQ